MLLTQRFNLLPKWRQDDEKNRNTSFLGLVDLLKYVSEKLPKSDYKMIEIGSYMGESTMMFASTGLFSTIYSIDPLEGDEEFNEIFGYDWDFVKSEFSNNLRMFNNIIHYKDYSYNVVNKFDDNSIDFIYIDGNHSYESVTKDLQLYLPKIKKGGFISGHDYCDFWASTKKAIINEIGIPDETFIDTSWIKKIK
jgi:cephalosporin hydroxylase